MKKAIVYVLALLALAGCKTEQEAKVMARYVPERADDFVFDH